MVCVQDPEIFKRVCFRMSGCLIYVYFLTPAIAIGWFILIIFKDQVLHDQGVHPFVMKTNVDWMEFMSQQMFRIYKNGRLQAIRLYIRVLIDQQMFGGIILVQKAGMPGLH